MKRFSTIIVIMAIALTGIATAQEVESWEGASKNPPQTSSSGCEICGVNNCTDPHILCQSCGKVPCECTDSEDVELCSTCNVQLTECDGHEPSSPAVCSRCDQQDCNRSCSECEEHKGVWNCNKEHGVKVDPCQNGDEPGCQIGTVPEEKREAERLAAERDELVRLASKTADLVTKQELQNQIAQIDSLIANKISAALRRVQVPGYSPARIKELLEIVASWNNEFKDELVWLRDNQENLKVVLQHKDDIKWLSENKARVESVANWYDANAEQLYQMLEDYRGLLKYSDGSAVLDRNGKPVEFPLVDMQVRIRSLEAREEGLPALFVLIVGGIATLFSVIALIVALKK